MQLECEYSFAPVAMPLAPLPTFRPRWAAARRPRLTRHLLPYPLHITALPCFNLQAKVGGGAETKIDQALPNHTKALELVSGFLGDAFHGVSCGCF